MFVRIVWINFNGFLIVKFYIRLINNAGDNLLTFLRGSICLNILACERIIITVKAIGVQNDFICNFSPCVSIRRTIPLNCYFIVCSSVFTFVILMFYNLFNSRCFWNPYTIKLRTANVWYIISTSYSPTIFI